MVKNSACRLTECRLAGSTKVRFEADGTPGLDARGDLTLLDHVCSSGTSISTIVPGQVRFLEASGFAVQGTAHIEASYASVVMKKDAQWIEVNAMVLEGAPSVAVRFIDDGVSLTAQPAVVSKSKPILASAPLPKGSRSTPAKAAGASPAVPRGVKALGRDLRVELEVIVDEKGKIQKVLTTKGMPSLIPAALNALKTWNVEAATEDGRPVVASLAVVLDFKSPD